MFAAWGDESSGEIRITSAMVTADFVDYSGWHRGMFEPFVIAFGETPEVAEKLAREYLDGTRTEQIPFDRSVLPPRPKGVRKMMTHVALDGTVTVTEK